MLKRECTLGFSLLTSINFGLCPKIVLRVDLRDLAYVSALLARSKPQNLNFELRTSKKKRRLLYENVTVFSPSTHSSFEPCHVAIGLVKKFNYLSCLYFM